MSQWKDKVVWVTGASSGFGEALARRFAHQGARLVLSARRQSQLSSLAKEIGEDRTLVLPLDVTDEEAVKNAVEVFLQKFDRLDCLFNNAGVTQRSLAKDTNLATYRQLMDANFFGAVALTQALLPTFMKQQGGQIAVTSSVAGKYGAPMRTGYSAAKHALHGYFDSLRLELAPFNVKVSMIVLGAVKTDISKSALTGDGTNFGEMDPLQASAPAPEELLDDLFTQLSAEKRELVIGRGIEIDALSVLREDPDRFYEMMLDITMKRYMNKTH